MYNTQFSQMMTEIFGSPVFAEVSPKYEVAFFDPCGEQQGCREFDCQEAADDCARIVTRDHPELWATLSEPESPITYLYVAGSCDRFRLEQA